MNIKHSIVFSFYVIEHVRCNCKFNYIQSGKKAIDIHCDSNEIRIRKYENIVKESDQNEEKSIEIVREHNASDMKLKKRTIA